MNRIPALIRPLLYPFSWAFAAGVALRNRAFETRLLTVTSLDIPVISVGNIVTGGVGKTPLVRFIADYCSKRGRRVGIVSRGYKRMTTGVVDVSDGTGKVAGPREGGDEAVQLAQTLPGSIVVVGERRVDAAKRARELGADIIIADDGYQHRYLGRDLNILVLDSRVDLRSESMLPAGRMREPLASIRRADVVALSHTGEARPEWITILRDFYNGTFVGFRYRALPARWAHDRSEVAQGSLPDDKVLAFSGIGNHERFVETLRTAGYDIGGDIRFPDHHSYSAEDFRRIGALKEESGCRMCITTEKDIVRIDSENINALHFLQERNVLFVPISIEFTEGESFLYQKLMTVLNRTS